MLDKRERMVEGREGMVKVELLESAENFGADPPTGSKAK